MGTVDIVLKWIGEAVIYGGGAVAIAFLTFKFLGQKWIENKFQERLDQLKHEQAKELQRLRIEIDSLVSGRLKLQQKEFDLLPEAWGKLDLAYGQVTALVSPFQQLANLDTLTPVQLEEFLESTQLLPSQKQEVRVAREKMKTYDEIKMRYRLRDVKLAISEFHNFIARNGIFFPKTLKDNLNKISELLWAALTSKEVGMEAKDYKMQREGWDQIQKDARPIYVAVEQEIQARLESHGTSK